MPPQNKPGTGKDPFKMIVLMLILVGVVLIGGVGYLFIQSHFKRHPRPEAKARPTPTPAPTPPTWKSDTYPPPNIIKVATDESAMAELPAGKFKNAQNETIEVEKSYLGVYPVTNSQFLKFTRETGYLTLAERLGWGVRDLGVSGQKIAIGAVWNSARALNQSDLAFGDLMQNPVVYVSYDDALAYCRWAGLQLAPRKLREYAFHGTDERRFPWGDVADRSRFTPLGSDFLEPVTNYPEGAGPFGHQQLYGPMKEWSADSADTSNTVSSLRVYLHMPANADTSPAVSRFLSADSVGFRAQYVPNEAGGAAADPEKQKRLQAPFLEPELELIAAGTATLGDLAGREDERPAMTISLPAFQIGKREVSNLEYSKFVNATGRKAPPNQTWGTFSFNDPDQPVVNVTWEDARAYAIWLSQRSGKSYRLPSEAEWERAARGGLESASYPWGNDINEESGFPSDDNFIIVRVTSSDLPNIRFGYLLPHQVGSFATNGFGLSNMGGNVSEWCEDWYDVNYYKHRPAASPQCGDPSSGQRVVRGANYTSEVSIEQSGGQEMRYQGDAVRVARRDHLPPSFVSPTIGFRLAMDAQ